MAISSSLQLPHTGSGKSETGAHIAYIFARVNEGNHCVLYCAPSNKAVDVVHGEGIEMCLIIAILCFFQKEILYF